MSKKGPTPFGGLDISEDVIATIAGAAAIECYGLVGMVPRKVTDGFAELLGRESLSKGVTVVIDGQEVRIDLYIIVTYGVKISEVANNVREQVKYSVENATGLVVKELNVNVQGVQVN
jgi:uncharacterized alkaline shock family protein YloU